MSTLKIEDLHVGVNTETGLKPILNGINLVINTNETHAIMGPNGSGKSTLAYALAGHPKYEVTSGSVTLDGEDVLEMSVDERAKAGLFLAMQYPVEVPGVTVTNFLRSAKTAIDGEAPKLRNWTKDLKQAMENLRVDPAFASRNVNEGFSGGEEASRDPAARDAQAEVRRPRRDRLRPRRRRAAHRVRRRQPRQGRHRRRHHAHHPLHAHPQLHQARSRPCDHQCKVAEEGGPELAERLENEGYDRFFTAGV